MSTPAHPFHGTAILLGEAGVLLRGASGAGKSQLALALVAEAHARGMFVRLIGDDRVSISAQAGRLVVRGHPAIAGQIEERGTAIVELETAKAAILRFLVDLETDPPRLPLVEAPVTELCGIDLPLLTMRAGLSPQEQARRVFAFIKRAR
jgi:hypothetical protein